MHLCLLYKFFPFLKKEEEIFLDIWNAEIWLSTALVKIDSYTSR